MGFMEIFIKNDEPEEVSSQPKLNTHVTETPPVEKQPEARSQEILPPGAANITGAANFSSAVFVDETGTINHVYEEAKLSDLSRSIFKVQQIRASFPVTIADEVVRQTIPGLLTAANLVTTELRADAELRIITLNTALQEHLVDQSKKIESLTVEINELAAAIEAKRQEIANAQQSKEVFGKAVEQESKVIQENLAYLP